MNHGFVRLASAVPSLRVADCSYNTGQIALMMGKAREMKVAVVCFPELSITSYTCQDLFRQKRLLDEAEEALRRLLESTAENPVVGIVGMPVRYLNVLLNCAVVFQRGRVLGVVAKTFLPNYNEFYEMRWFTSAAHVAEGRLWLAGQQVELTRNRLFRTPDFTFGVELCEDLWAPVPPSSHLCLRGAEVVFNLSADNDLVGKTAYLQTLVEQQSARCICGYVYSGCGFGESTQDLVFGGKSLVYENGARLLFRHQRDTMPHLEAVEVDIDRIRAERMANTTFSAASEQVKDMQVGMVQVDDVVRMDMVTDTLTRWVNPHPFVPSGRHLDLRCEEIFGIQTLGLAKRVEHTHARHLVLGISGGLDSTLALLVCARTTDLLGLPRHTIVGVTMPGFGTTGRTYNNAMDLMKTLGVTIREISVKDACVQHFKDIVHDAAVHDVTYENSQARERTQILMDVANQMNGLVVGTGDLSELALGWATYNGDHMSMYGVNVSVPKTLVKHLVGWVADRGENAEESRILRDIIDTPISPELIPADEQGNITQKTEDLVGPYELHDFFLYHFLRQGSTPEKIRYLALHAFRGVYDDAFISKWLNTFIRRFFNQQFKRSCLPDGPKVGSCSLSPRGDWRMPTDASSEAWKFQ